MVVNRPKSDADFEAGRHRGFQGGVDDVDLFNSGN
jgi:hypothetical protein